MTFMERCAALTPQEAKRLAATIAKGSRRTWWAARDAVEVAGYDSSGVAAVNAAWDALGPCEAREEVCRAVLWAARAIAVRDRIAPNHYARIVRPFAGWL